MDKLPNPQKYPPNRQCYTKRQRLIAILFMIFCFQLPFFISSFTFLYAVLTLDFKILAILGFISILQLPVRKNQKFIKYILNNLRPHLYFQKFDKYYDEPIPQNTKCIFSFHPHAVLCWAVSTNMHDPNDPMNNMVGLMSRFMLTTPIVGIIFRFWGFQSVDPSNINKLMSQGKNVGLVPGGYQQATLTTPKQLRVYIKQRVGFIKYALKYGYTIYPTLVFNQHKAYWTFDYLTKIRLLLNKLKIPACLFFGPYGIFTNPNFDYITVVGKGIKGNQNAQKQQIHRVHEEYIKEIQRLYQKYKTLNNNVPLVIY